MSSEVATPDPMKRANYAWFMPIITRWMDNDVYGHINNVHYYSYFDTVANSYLIREGGLDIQNSEEIGYIVHSQCSYLSALAFPDAIEGGFRVNRLGNSSVEYGIGIFLAGEDKASAHGTFTHVFVNRQTEKPVAISGHMRAALSEAVVEGESPR